MCDCECDSSSPHRDARARLPLRGARRTRAMDDEVEEIVDGVLASVPELLSSVCDRDGILSGLLSYTPFGVTGGQLMFEPYYRQLRGVAR